VGIEEVLNLHTHWVIDTAPIIYYIEEHPKYLPLVDQIFPRLSSASNSIYAFSSILTLTEVLPHPCVKTIMISPNVIGIFCCTREISFCFRLMKSSLRAPQKFERNTSIGRQMPYNWRRGWNTMPRCLSRMINA